MKTTKMRAELPMPSQRMASGIQASGGTGRRIWKIGKAIQRTFFHQPMAMPSGRPTRPASSQPPMTICRLAPMCWPSVLPR